MKALLAVTVAAVLLSQDAPKDPDARPFTDTFMVDEKDLASTGRNPYFILEPGYQLVLENPARKEVLTITVLDETRKIGAVETRIVEERETVDGKETEVSRNYFALCRRTNSVYYFGEDVDVYKDGKVVSHAGAWLAGVDGARPGLLMPGRPLNGARYYQEIAPGVALDRAEHRDDKATVETPAGAFENCLVVVETSPLEPGHESLKAYARGIGLVQDDVLKLVKHGARRHDSDRDGKSDN